MTQDRFELKGKFKGYISPKTLYNLAKVEIIDALADMTTDEALCLGNQIREERNYEWLYENNEDCINEQLDGWEPWDLLQLDYDDYSDFFYMDYGEPAFTNDIWHDLDTDEIAEDILDGRLYRAYWSEDIRNIMDDYIEAKEFLENLNEYRVEGEELLAKFTNCQADVSDLLQYIDRITKNDDVWKEGE